MKLYLMLLSYLLFISAILLIFFITYDHYFDVNFIESRELRHLECISESKAIRLNTFLAERKDDAIFLATTEGVNEIFHKREFKGDNIESVVEISNITNISSDTYDELKIFQNIYNYSDMFLISFNGDILWDASSDNINTNLTLELRNDSDLTKIYHNVINSLDVEILKSKYNRDGEAVSVFVASPVLKFNTETQKNILIGIIVLQFNAEIIEKLISSSIGIENLGEVYIVDDKGIFVTSSLYEKKYPNVSLDQVNKCFFNYNGHDDHQSRKGEETKMSGAYDNYAGIPVLGSYYYILQPKWCIFTEIEKGSFINNYPEDLDIIDKIVGYILMSLIIFIFISVFVVNRYFQLKVRSKK